MLHQILTSRSICHELRITPSLLFASVWRSRALSQGNDLLCIQQVVCIITYSDAELVPIHPCPTCHLCRYHWASKYGRGRCSARSGDRRSMSGISPTSFDLIISCLADAPLILPFCGDSWAKTWSYSCFDRLTIQSCSPRPALMPSTLPIPNGVCSSSLKIFAAFDVTPGPAECACDSM